MRFLSYYLIKTNTAFQLFPVLLAVVQRCGILTGDINQTRAFPAELTHLINRVLVDNTSNWLNAQDDKSITLVTDIGTIFGLVITVVLFVAKGGKVRLAGCALTTSKSGSDLADLAINTVQEKAKVPLDTMKRVVGGVCADGAFVNAPFKERCKDLLDNSELVFKWDLMHLINRTHCNARGLTKSEKEANAAMGDADDQEDADEPIVDLIVEPIVDLTQAQTKLITRLLDYVQSQAKKWRSGLDYTRLVVETGDFLRPKVMSSTRVSLYEFEQIHRFLQVMKYWDNPWELEVLAQLYCPVLFAVKIFMKKVQKTEVSAEYVDRVFVKGEGKRSMELALESAIKLSKGHDIEYLKTTEDCEILDSKTPFGKELYMFMKKNSPILKPSSLTNSNSRTRGTSVITFETLVGVLKTFINTFWVEVARRTCHTELGKDYITFSEAPAETLFSEYKFITDHQPSLGFYTVASLIRIGKP